MHTETLAIKDNIFIGTDSHLKDIGFDEKGNSWYLNFDKDISISLYTVWRLFNNDIIALISNDHQQQFGLLNPVDLIADLKRNLDNKTLKEIRIEKNTGDLILNFEGNVKLIAYISSMGYESYEVFADGKQIVGKGGGDIAIFHLK